MRARLPNLIMLAVLVLIPCKASAQELTSTTIEAYLAGMQEIIQYLDSQGLMDESSEAMETSRWESYATSQHVASIINKYGFNVETFGDVHLRIIQAYAAIKMAEHGAEMDADMAQAREEIMSNPYMDDAQKQQMLQNLEMAQAQYRVYQNVPEADKNAVRPYTDRIEQVYNIED